MRPPNKQHPNVRDHVPRFRAFAKANPRALYGSPALYWALSMHPEAPFYAHQTFIDQEDRELYQIACELSLTQRHKLADYIDQQVWP